MLKINRNAGLKTLSALIIAMGTTFSIANTAQAATVYATSATTENVTSFGSGVLTGTADSGGAWLSNTSDPPTLLGSITFGFGLSLYDGVGADIELIDVGQSADESYDVALSLNGISFSSIGQFTTLVNGIDINGLFAGAFSFIRVTNTSRLNSADLDTARAFHTNGPSPVPLPASLPLLLGAIGGFGILRRRKKA